MPTFVVHALFLVSSVVLTFLWTKSPALVPYNLQFVGSLILIYFICRTLLKKDRKLILTLDAVTFISLTLLLVISTGSLYSPVFFLLYLLLFTISLLFEPTLSVLLSLSLLVIFLIDSSSASLDNIALINLATLTAITPLALIFGRKYLEALESQGKIQILRNIISKEQTDSLLWITTKANPTLVSIIDAVGDTLIHLNSVKTKISVDQLIEKLRSIHSDLVTLYRSTNTLKENIKEGGEENK